MLQTSHIYIDEDIQITIHPTDVHLEPITAGAQSLESKHGRRMEIPQFEPYLILGHGKKIGITKDFKVVCMKTAKVLYSPRDSFNPNSLVLGVFPPTSKVKVDPKELIMGKEHIILYLEVMVDDVHEASAEIRLVSSLLGGFFSS